MQHPCFLFYPCSSRTDYTWERTNCYTLEYPSLIIESDKIYENHCLTYKSKTRKWKLSSCILSCSLTMFGCCIFLHILASLSNFWKSETESRIKTIKITMLFALQRCLLPTYCIITSSFKLSQNSEAIIIGD